VGRNLSEGEILHFIKEDGELIYKMPIEFIVLLSDPQKSMYLNEVLDNELSKDHRSQDIKKIAEVVDALEKKLSLEDVEAILNKYFTFRSHFNYDDMKALLSVCPDKMVCLAVLLKKSVTKEDWQGAKNCIWLNDDLLDTEKKEILNTIKFS
jgi:hypothetical protein